MGKKYKAHLEKAKKFTEKNKLFTVIILIVSVYLTFNIVNGIIHKNDKLSSDNAAVETVEQSEETTSLSEEGNEDNEENEYNHFRFYWVDLWILLIAGGFCVVMIIREKKKAREKL